MTPESPTPPGRRTDGRRTKEWSRRRGYRRWRRSELVGWPTSIWRRTCRAAGRRDAPRTGQWSGRLGTRAGAGRPGDRGGGLGPRGPCAELPAVDGGRRAVLVSGWPPSSRGGPGPHQFLLPRRHRPPLTVARTDDASPGPGRPDRRAEPALPSGQRRVVGGRRGASAILTAMASWVVSGAAWLLDQLGGAPASSTMIDVSASWSTTHYQVMAVIAGAAAAPLLLGAMLQAIYRQSTEHLVRAALAHLPLAFLLSGDASYWSACHWPPPTPSAPRCRRQRRRPGDGPVRSGDHAPWGRSHRGRGRAVLRRPADRPAGGGRRGPVGIESVVRRRGRRHGPLPAVGLRSLGCPAIADWCRRRVDTLAALVLSKFVIVAILSLATGAIDSSGGFATVLSGVALLIVAASTPSPCSA